MNQFKENDPVICDYYGIGYVKKVSKDTKAVYPIQVEFQSDNSIVKYTSDGKENQSGEITLKHDNHNWKP